MIDSDLYKIILFYSSYFLPTQESQVRKDEAMRFWVSDQLWYWVILLCSICVTKTNLNENKIINKKVECEHDLMFMPFKHNIARVLLDMSNILTPNHSKY